MFKYRVAGVAFDGDPFDYVKESKDVFIDFLLDDLKELAGLQHTGLNVLWVNGYKVIVEGQGRLYLIEQLER